MGKYDIKDKSIEAIRFRKRLKGARARARKRGVLTRRGTFLVNKRGSLRATKLAMIYLAKMMKRNKLAFDYSRLAYFIAQITDKPELASDTIHQTARELYVFSGGEFYMLRVVFDNEFYYVSI